MEKQALLDAIAAWLNRYESEHPSNNDVACTVSFLAQPDCYYWNGEKFYVHSETE